MDLISEELNINLERGLREDLHCFQNFELYHFVPSIVSRLLRQPLEGHYFVFILFIYLCKSKHSTVHIKIIKNKHKDDLY